MLVLSQNTKRESGRKAQSSNIQVSHRVLESLTAYLGCQSCCVDCSDNIGSEGHVEDVARSDGWYSRHQ